MITFFPIRFDNGFGMGWRQANMMKYMVGLLPHFGFGSTPSQALYLVIAIEQS
jgi:hypothetical protein